jgi:hypothetical protein
MITLDSKPGYYIDRDVDARTEKRLRRKARLTKNERKRYILLNTDKKCELSGRDVKKRGHVHHARMVSAGGYKNYENLYYLGEEEHYKLHEIAREIAKSQGRPEADVVEELTHEAVQLAKWGRCEAGEDPEKVYKRELRIDKMHRARSEAKQQTMKDYLNSLEG